MIDDSDLEETQAKLRRALDPTVPMPNVRLKDPLVVADESLRSFHRGGMVICAGLCAASILIIVLAKLTSNTSPGPAVVFPMISAVGIMAFQGIALIRTRLLRIETELAELRKMLESGRSDAKP